MKNLKFITVPIMACLFFFISCEKEESKESTETRPIEIIEGQKEASFNFKQLEELQSGGHIEELEAALIKNADQFNDVEGLQQVVGDYTPNLELFNEYLRFKGEKEIDVESFYVQGQRILSNDEATVDEFIDLLGSNNIYTDAQLNLFKGLDEVMRQDLTKDQYLREVDAFKERVTQQEELSLSERNVMLLYASVVKGFIYTDHFTAEKNKCKECMRKNRWRIFGWGAFYWLITLIPCIFSGPGFIACIIATAGFWALYAIKVHCSGACPWI
ncbi:hypothetical protein [Aquimarina brevivitae]|uniref:Uncharacterized protein n=1 Tax=Aquimarina brevivitae TaxID=323412 RepID=A0A4Q7PIS5_9FLAO|nr:hypothetical protein [Aquimarina brevivitae]RZT00168.1 hypothetical protein EV197_1401 [Aquimarina brevivitae]